MGVVAPIPVTTIVFVVLMVWFPGSVRGFGMRDSPRPERAGHAWLLTM